MLRNVGSATLGNFTNTGTIDLANASVTTLVGTITNSGTMRLNSTGSTTQLLINGAVTLQGGGTLSLSDQPYLNSQIVAATGTDTLTNAAGHTIQGAGLIGAGGLALVN